MLHESVLVPVNHAFSPTDFKSLQTALGERLYPCEGEFLLGSKLQKNGQRSELDLGVSQIFLSQTQHVWKRGVARVQQFQEARMAFDNITDNLRRALSDRTGYEGLGRQLCGRGYFAMCSDNKTFQPSQVATQNRRCQLWVCRPTSEENSVYAVKAGQWFLNEPSSVFPVDGDTTTPADTRPMAGNILALIISPQVTADDAPFKALGATFRRLIFYPYGGTSLRVPLRTACLTLISVKNYKADLTTPPPNYYTVQIDPVTGRENSCRP